MVSDGLKIIRGITDINGLPIMAPSTEQFELFVGFSL
jgi:hypothetical protein